MITMCNLINLNVHLSVYGNSVTNSSLVAGSQQTPFACWFCLEISTTNLTFKSYYQQFKHEVIALILNKIIVFLIAVCLRFTAQKHPVSAVRAFATNISLSSISVPLSSTFLRNFSPTHSSSYVLFSHQVTQDYFLHCWSSEASFNKCYSNKECCLNSNQPHLVASMEARKTLIDNLFQMTPIITRKACFKPPLKAH